MSLLETATAYPGRALAALTLLLAAGGGAFLALTAPQTPAPGLVAGPEVVAPADGGLEVPVEDQDAVNLLTAQARALRADPARVDTDNPSLVVAYEGADQAGALTGRLSTQGTSGACYTVTFTLTRAWVVDGDPAGVLVGEPGKGRPGHCADPGAGQAGRGASR